MGAWIEIKLHILHNYMVLLSHPTMGAWIEISLGYPKSLIGFVAPHDGCVD